MIEREENTYGVYETWWDFLPIQAGVAVWEWLIWIISND